jgi:hypothetical protein
MASQSPHGLRVKERDPIILGLIERAQAEARHFLRMKSHPPKDWSQDELKRLKAGAKSKRARRRSRNRWVDQSHPFEAPALNEWKTTAPAAPHGVRRRWV